MFTRVAFALTGVTLLCLFVASILMTTADAGPVIQVTHPEKIFSDGKAHHFTYKAGEGSGIRYFILKSSDGIIRAAFDACDVCWAENKGYSQKGDSMTCNNCGKRFPSARINEVHGGCNPAPLNRTIENGNVIIQVTDLLQGKRYFDLKGVKR